MSAEKSGKFTNASARTLCFVAVPFIARPSTAMRVRTTQCETCVDGADDSEPEPGGLGPRVRLVHLRTDGVRGRGKPAETLRRSATAYGRRCVYCNGHESRLSRRTQTPQPSLLRDRKSCRLHRRSSLIVPYAHDTVTSHWHYDRASVF